MSLLLDAAIHAEVARVWGNEPAEMAACRRLIAFYCLYGVDKSPLAVELARVSLWLATAAFSSKSRKDKVSAAGSAPGLMRWWAIRPGTRSGRISCGAAPEGNCRSGRGIAHSVSLATPISG